MIVLFIYYYIYLFYNLIYTIVAVHPRRSSHGFLLLVCAALWLVDGNRMGQFDELEFKGLDTDEVWRRQLAALSPAEAEKHVLAALGYVFTVGSLFYPVTWFFFQFSWN